MPLNPAPLCWGKRTRLLGKDKSTRGRMCFHEGVIQFKAVGNTPACYLEENTHEAFQGFLFHFSFRIIFCLMHHLLKERGSPFPFGHLWRLVKSDEFFACYFSATSEQFLASCIFPSSQRSFLQTRAEKKGKPETSTATCLPLPMGLDSRTACLAFSPGIDFTIKE